jgi:hypothetical protein
MNTRNWLVMAFGALALATFSIFGGASMAPYAHAQPLAQARQVTSAPGLQSAADPFKICLFEDRSECLRSHGADAQLTIESSDYAVFHWVNNLQGQMQAEDAGGKCLRSYADGSVGLAFGGCSSSNDDEWWVVNIDDTTLRTTFQQFGAPGTTPVFIGTYGESSGLGVWMDVPHQGFFSGWYFR